MTREWPPEIYGGAGVHVEYLAHQLQNYADIAVHCFGSPRGDAIAHSVPLEFAEANAAMQTLAVDLAITASMDRPDVVHSHTWYANLAGHMASLLHEIPHVLTAHSLEPLRPWKAEQLGGGYRISCWVEQTAYENAAAVIAVSDGMRRDVLDCYPSVDPDRVHVIRNGIDYANYRHDPATVEIEALGIDPAVPYILFVGRITRQKGLPHLLNAVRHVGTESPLVMCASAPDTPELGDEVRQLVAQLRTEGHLVHWIEEHLARPTLIQLLSHAGVFVCPSVYEPLGIVNLEAMACETAVVASDVGGIPEVVVDGDTGLLVHYDETEPHEFDLALARAIQGVLGDPTRARSMGLRGRERAVAEFGWDAVARKTVDVYRAVCQ